MIYKVQEAINVDIIYIEKCAQKLLDSDCGVTRLSNQELINERYTEMIVEKCMDIVLTKGIIKVGLLATKFNIPVSYLSIMKVVGLQYSNKCDSSYLSTKFVSLQ